MSDTVSTSSMVEGWLKSGGQASSPEQVSDVLQGKDISQAQVEPEEVVRAENSTIDGQEQTVSEDTPTDSSEAESTAQAKAETEQANQKTSSDKEVITITDEKGRRKVEVDYSNKDQLRKYVQMAHGARKWQAERDQAKQELTTERQKSADIQANWSKLDDAYQQGGIEGLVDRVEGRQGAFKEYVKKVAEFYAKASPAEIEKYETAEMEKKRAQEIEQIRKENEEFKKQMTATKEEAELRSLESDVHPVFSKYRFADKLGDANDEHMFDEMLWNTALKRLEPYEEQGLPLTQELIEREFSSVAKSIRKRIGLQAEKKAAKAVEQKKKEATENVQAKVKSGYTTGGIAKEAGDMINQGNLTGLLKQWNKYGGVFRK